MDEYIERDAAIRMLRGSAIEKYPLSFSSGIFASADELEKLPAYDVAPVRHGRWAIDEFGHYCTVCREYGPEIEEDAEIVDLLKYGTPYCHNCGARMDLEEV